MPSIFLFGSSSAVGKYIITLCAKNKTHKPFVFQRNLVSAPDRYQPFFSTISPSDSDCPEISTELTIISLLPIWTFAEFIAIYLKSNPQLIPLLKRVVVCSSSSSITKQYSFSHSDRVLSKRLLNAEKYLYSIAPIYDFELIIFRPTIVYDDYESNARGITAFASSISHLGFIVLPVNTGYRQPIHAYQLASIIYLSCTNSLMKFSFSSPQLVGGDVIVSFAKMCIALSESTGKKIRVFYLPMFIYHFILRLITFISPSFAAPFARVLVDMANFPSTSSFLSISCKRYPFRALDLD